MNDCMYEGKKSGFTLIELLVVIVILGVLIGIVFSVGMYLFGDQEAKKAKVEINIIRLALDEYKINQGDYPEAPCEGVSADDEMSRGFEVLKALCYAKDKEEILSAGILKLLPIDNLSIGEMPENEEVLFLEDPWGEPYIYAYPRPDKKSGYMLFSKGPDLVCSDYSSDSDEEDNLPDSDNISATTN